MSLPTIAPEDAKRLVDQGASLIDIRDADERARGYVPGSHHSPLQKLGSLEGASAPIIFHCASGLRTGQNAARLRQATPGEAYILAGGLNAWKKAGLPVAREAGAPIEIQRQVMIGAGGFVLLFVLLGTFVSPLFYAFAGFVGAGLLFSGITGICAMARALAVMPWNRGPASA